MSEDFMEQFAGLEEFYPGSKKKRREPLPPEVVPDENWDSKPYIKTLPSGKDIEMYTIGALAGALGRPIITIRKWIREGNLPPSPYRLPTKKNKHGEDHKGRRLYTRAMIDTAVNVFKSNGLMDTKRIDWSQHRLVPQELNEAWLKLREE
jgi:hypothetical protein